MALISEKDAQTLKDRFKRELKKDVNIWLFSQKTLGLTIPGRECAHCEDTEHLMEELAALSPKLHLEVKDFYTDTEAAAEAGVERIPATVFSTDAVTNVKFYGIPMGYEFGTMIEDVVTLSRGVSPLSLASRKKLKQLKGSVHIQVFVTPTCVYCPQVARLAHAFAMENPNIVADVVEVQEFPMLVQRYMVSGVPKTVINNSVQFVGAVSEEAFVDKVLEAAGVSIEEQKAPALSVAPELGPSTRATG
jgi:glutaredoxin-like protein